MCARCGLGSKVLVDNGMATDFSDGLVAFSQVVVLIVPLTMTAMAEMQELLSLQDEIKKELKNGEREAVEVTNSPL
eukprot:SAG31_NODE_26093_length_448_cov_1.189112_1_plen_76_part_00